jgi:hydroxymethylglutaryl-CoA lyase
MLSLPSSVTVVEVAPRDGLQSFPRWIDTDLKVRIVDCLSRAGFPVIEVSGFAHPRAIPNLRDAEQVCERIVRRDGVRYRGLVPNARGAERAMTCRLDEILGLVVVSPTYLQKNQNMSPDQAMDEAVAAFRIADRHHVDFTAAVAMAFWCPYEGTTPDENVLSMVARLRNAGIRRFYLAGSAGMEDPSHVSRLFNRVFDAVPDIELGFHIHNLGGMATANIVAALDAGASRLEGAICGIGGGIAMPSSLGAVGNYPTEDLVAMLSLMGIDTGLTADAALHAANEIAALLDVVPRSHAGQGITRHNVSQRAELHAG